MSAREIEAAYAHCARLTREGSRSFWAALRLLPPRPRRGMAALYAFCRTADDIADGPGSPEERAEALARLRRTLEQGLWGLPSDPVTLALADTVRRDGVRREDLLAILDGVAMDCRPVRYATFKELEGYCERVASAVGCASIAVFGVRDEAARQEARALGIALQLTNILRDLREDALAGRCYLPEDELGRFGVSGADLGRTEATPALKRLVCFQVDRARRYFRQAEGLERSLPRATRFFPGSLAAVYGTLLAQIEAAGYDPLAEPPRVGRLRAAALTARAWLSRLAG